jgi:Glycosyl hydrolases family 31/Domain of unknown function (DUF5110)/Carbohydrate binding module (family 6)
MLGGWTEVAMRLAWIATVSAANRRSAAGAVAVAARPSRRYAVHAAAVTGVLIAAGLAAAGGRAVSDRSPVNLATRVSFAAGLPRRSAIVEAGNARFEVLGPTLVRLEYSPSRHFENAPTVNILNRRFPVPPYRTSVSGGWLTIETTAMTLRYRLHSGPFGPRNTTLAYSDGRRAATVHPTWEWECPFGQSCQAGAAALAGGAAIATNHTGYDSTAGFVADFGQPGASATWTVLGASAGRAGLTLRYSNSIGAPGPGRRTISLDVNGSRVRTLTLPPTSSWNRWSTVATTVPLRAGTNTVSLLCAGGDSCNVNLDTLAVGPAGVPAPMPPRTGPLGGWIRSFDYYTYGEGPYRTGYTCPGSATGADCLARLERLHTDGLLNRAGWRLLDDTQSAVWTHRGWVSPRPAGGDVEDGYLFAYGDDYHAALEQLAQLTGPAPLLPSYLFGVWFSRYYPYTAAYYQKHLIPQFRANRVPLDALSVDTDWKSPNTWDGWEWNPNLFPHPQAFLDWAKSQGIHVTLNIHSSISASDPKVVEAQRIAGHDLTLTSCFSGTCYVWDWSQVPQAESNFALQQSFDKQGVAFWWLDWCCDGSSVSMRGLTPDSWIDHLYAQTMVNKGQRGFVLARLGSSYQNPGQVYPAGPWSNHTSTIHFTGDSWGTWNTLRYQAMLAPAEASIGEPYTSDDIGSFLGPPPGGPADTPDLYDRWVQLGVFQPILRLHSNHGYRLPWNYPQPVHNITDAFLRLRQALLPYSYTLAAQAHFTGLPMTRPLYLDYPTLAAAYHHPAEYLYGPGVLIAPVTTPGKNASTTVWFPPGRWVDYFTGATFTGPRTATLDVPLDRMPVFVQAGGIVPEQPYMTHVGAAPVNPLTLNVYAGGDGRFSLYGDAGQGLGYTSGQHTTTQICYLEAGFGRSGGCRPPASSGRRGTGASALVVAAAQGNYPGAPASRAYQIHLIDLTKPRLVLLNQHPLPQRPAASSAPGWHYDTATDTVIITTPTLPTGRPTVITQVGGRPVSGPEPGSQAGSRR